MAGGKRGKSTGAAKAQRQRAKARARAKAKVKGEQTEKEEEEEETKVAAPPTRITAETAGLHEIAGKLSDERRAELRRRMQRRRGALAVRSGRVRLRDEEVEGEETQMLSAMAGGKGGAQSAHMKKMLGSFLKYGAEESMRGMDMSRGTVQKALAAQSQMSRSQRKSMPMSQADLRALADRIDERQAEVDEAHARKKGGEAVEPEAKAAVIREGAARMVVDFDDDDE